MARVLCVLMMAVALTGCRSAPGPDVYAGVTSATVSDYPRAFDATKDVLREMGFELDRIDASAGIITTRPRTGSGLGTPWVPTSDGLNDLAHRNRRVASVRFAPVGVERPDDLRAYDGAIDVEWTIEVQRVYVPGRRPSPTSVRLGGVWRDRDLPLAGERVRFATHIDIDEELAARGIDSLVQRLTTEDAPTTLR